MVGFRNAEHHAAKLTIVVAPVVLMMLIYRLLRSAEQHMAAVLGSPPDGYHL